MIDRSCHKFMTNAIWFLVWNSNQSQVKLVFFRLFLKSNPNFCIFHLSHVIDCCELVFVSGTRLTFLYYPITPCFIDFAVRKINSCNARDCLFSSFFPITLFLSPAAHISIVYFLVAQSQNTHTRGAGEGKCTWSVHKQQKFFRRSLITLVICWTTHNSILLPSFTIIVVPSFILRRQSDD